MAVLARPRVAGGVWLPCMSSVVGASLLTKRTERRRATQGQVTGEQEGCFDGVLLYEKSLGCPELGERSWESGPTSTLWESGWILRT